MANHKSAEKRARQTVKRAARNVSIRSSVKTAIRKLREAIASGDAEAIGSQLAVTSRAVRKAASKGVMHPRTAARRVARMVVAANKARA